MFSFFGAARDRKGGRDPARTRGRSLLPTTCLSASASSSSDSFFRAAAEKSIA
jgi:hypothetical protein